MKSVRISKRFKIYKSVRSAVSMAFPAAFPRSGKRPALKIGVLPDLLAQSDKLGHSKSDIRLFLAIWTKSGAYISGSIRDSVRVDLLGLPVGTVSPEERDRALAIRKERLNQSKRRAAA